MSITCATLEPTTLREPRVVSRPRRTMLDVGRLAAAYAIIWVHAAQLPALEGSKALGRFAVPFFVLVTILLVFEGVARNPERGSWAYVSSRSMRLYLPFLGWSGIYLAFKVIKGWLLPGEPNDYPGVDILWFGACYHLWFLPFILMVSLLAFAVAKMLVVRPGLAPAVFATTLAAGVLIAVTPMHFVLPDSYADLVLNALPATSCGIALAIACQLLGTRVLERRMATLGGGLVTAICIAWVWYFGRDRLVETLAGVGFLVVALAPVSGRVFSLLGKAGVLALGIYLSHVLWIKIMQAVTVRAGFSASWQRDVLVFLVSAVISTLLAWALSRWRWTAWLAA